MKSQWIFKKTKEPIKQKFKEKLSKQNLYHSMQEVFEPSTDQLKIIGINSKKKKKN